MAVSGLVGLAVTYYFDREDNIRLHNILKYGLKLVGLLLMAFSTSMPEASVTLCCILLLSQLIQPVLFLWCVSYSQTGSKPSSLDSHPGEFGTNLTYFVL